MKISVGNTFSKITEYTQEEYLIFRDVLSFWNKNAVFSTAFQNRIWDGYTRFFKGRVYPTGLEHLVSKAIPNIQFRRSHYAKPLIVDPNILKNKSMTGKYAYQYETVSIMLEKRRGIIYQATNAGKSTLTAAFIETLRVPTLFLVHQKELMKQIYETFTEETTLEIGRWGSGLDDRKFITIGMVPTIARRLKNKADREWLKGIKCVMVDECHLSSSKSFINTLEACTNASYRLGLSGTPLDKSNNIDNITIMSQLGEVITEVRNEELINLTVSSKPIITMVEIDHKGLDGVYPEVYQKGVIDNFERNTIIADTTVKLLEAGHTVLLLVKRVKHGENLKEILVSKGVITAFCYGESSDKDREREISAIREGKSKVLILSKIGQTGLNIEGLTAGIRCGGGRSVIETLQGLGRYLRNPNEGKNEVLMFDFMDKNAKYLEEHSQKRKASYEREKFEIHFRRLGASL